MKNRSIKEMLFYFSLVFIMVMSLSLAIMDCTEMDMSLVRMVFLTLLMTAAVSIIVVFPIILPAALIPVIGWITFMYYAQPEEIKLYWLKIKEFGSWLYGYLLGYNYFETGYSLVFAILYTAFTALVISFIVYSGRGGFALVLTGTIALSFFWFIYVEKARWYLAAFLFAAIMFYSYQIYRKKLREWRAADSTIEHDVGHNWMLCSAAVILISLTLSFTLPFNISPVRWTWLNDKVVSLFPFISEWRNDSQESFSYGFNSRFSLNSAGYLNKKLGGELRQDSSILMTVKTKGEDILYLRGTVRDRYSESSWYKSKKDHKVYSPGESMPLPFGNGVNTYEKELEITYEKLLTSTVFAPYSVYQVQHRSKRIYADGDSEVYTSKMTMKQESYIVKSKLPYIDVNKLRQAKAESLGVNEYDLYTSIGSDIPERVISLAQEITKAQNNNFDKAKSIEKYLRENYKYTYNPPRLPSKAEFTDHFLFEGKEGYCTYFATSMAVLLRASDVPCRYVEGFVATYEGDEKWEVRGTDSHAWVEVYFDDYGWVTFEPTPQYPVIRFAEPRATAEENMSASVDDTAVINIDMTGISRDRREIEDREELVSEDMYQTGGERSFSIGNTLLLVLLILLAVRVAYKYIRWIMKEINLGRAKGRRFAMAYLEDIIWYLRRAGFEMNKEETLREFLKRIKSYYEERFSDISNTIVMLERIRYSDYELSSEERRSLEIFRKDVKRLALLKAGFVKFVVSLYIIGR
ncbi:MAG TPA: transglutaminaseTgpA domain-containing protein [Clostridia bacterium]|nr:transglutaminaseTgpA domain-containing protein [Clostridia bacterium]